MAAGYPIGSAFAPSASSAGAFAAGIGGYQAPAQIRSNLPFPSQQAAGSIPFGGNSAQLSQSYANAYNAALALNQQNYENISKGYERALLDQSQKQHNTQQQHYELERQVMGDLNLAGSTRRQEIQDQYSALAGRQSQQLIDRGLGNSTIQASTNRGLALDEQKAQNQLAEQVANLRAQYGSNLGLARIGQHGQGSREATALTQAQLEFMNSVQSPYPDAGLYASLAMQYEQAKAAERAAGSGYGFNPATGGGGGVTYGPAYKFGPTPGTFGGGGHQTIAAPDSGLGFNPAFLGAGGPTGYAGGVPEVSGGGGGLVGDLSMMGTLIGTGAAMAGATGYGGQQQSSSPSLFGMSLKDLGYGG